MDDGGDSNTEGNGAEQGADGQGAAEGPGSETERFRAITDLDLRHNEAVTGESGVPRNQRDHELRRQKNSLAEFS
jgi:hypothetical protein